MKISKSALFYKQSYVNINDFLLKVTERRNERFLYKACQFEDTADATHEDFQRAGRGDL